VAGSTITITGTAVAGTAYSGATISTSNIMPSATLNHSPVCHRIKGLTAAQAGQTVVYTVTSTDSGAATVFDSIWGEALNPGPVIWANTARLTTAGYALYTTPPTDQAVATFNAVQPPVIAEFDGMVQMADIDSAINKDPTALIYDGLHPNELGAALCAQAFQNALSQMTVPTSRYGLISNLQPPGPRYAHLARPHAAGNWYTTECGGPHATAYTPVAGDMFAIPFYITSASRRIANWSAEMIATSGTATTCWFAIFDDRAYTGYPQQKYVDTTATALSLPTTVSVFNSASSGNASISQPMDPGLWWAVFQIGVLGTTPGGLRALKGPSPYMPNLATTGGQFTSASGPVAWKLTGQASAVLPKTFPAGGALADQVPLVGLKMA
jgi:hypothetical protein